MALGEEKIILRRVARWKAVFTSTFVPSLTDRVPQNKSRRGEEFEIGLYVCGVGTFEVWQ